MGYNGWGGALAKQGKLLEAVDCFPKVVELNSNCSRVDWSLAEILDELGE